MESGDSPQRESKEETAVQEQQVDSPIIGNSLYIQGPENWPSDVVYVCSNIWDEFAMQKWEKYVDGSQMGSYVEPFRDPVTGTCGLIATKPLVNSSWLGEYTGNFIARSFIHHSITSKVRFKKEQSTQKITKAEDIDGFMRMNYHSTM
jgi:hypothetical protein